MADLRQLADPAGYRRCDWDLATDAAGRARWQALFRWHLDDVLIPLIQEEYAPPAERLAAARRDYLAAYAALDGTTQPGGPLDIVVFTELRRAALRRYGFDDPFAGVKQRENDTALRLLPDVLAELDGAAPARRQELLVQGLMAGNIFDLGSAATIQRHRAGTTAFGHARASQPARPWLIDDVAAWWRRWSAAPAYRHVVFFVDNAGSDIVLGCVPLARWLVQAGARVTLAANSAPALNDVTAAELVPLLERCAALDGALQAALTGGRLGVVATGSAVPLIDLAALSEEFVAASADADLLILHGMGRAVESNFHARFTCDTLWSAVLKDEAVAARVGGKLFDCVFRFVPAERSAAHGGTRTHGHASL